jgi:hypothetical protein
MVALQAEMKILDKAINVERERRKQEYHAETLRQKIEADNERTRLMAEEKQRLQKDRQENAKRILYVKHHLSTGGASDTALLEGFGDRYGHALFSLTLTVVPQPLLHIHSTVVIAFCALSASSGDGGGAEAQGRRASTAGSDS